FLTGSVVVKVLADEKSSIFSTGVSANKNVDFSNKYREITSKDGKSKLKFNTVGKNTKLYVGNNAWDGELKSPVPVTDSRKAKKGDSGLPAEFTPRETFLVGSENASLSLCFI
ncbi:MAG TPA: hypothetical protein P5155_00185, partial [Candidatus Absconditabacterales bacterium]|nr:hypothetical protein [Candidatus Absconditabacterales bacterium]